MLLKDLKTYANLRYVGKQYVDDDNIAFINSFTVIDIGLSYSLENFRISMKVNNVFDVYYSTYGYAYEWEGYHEYYWPGATRNVYMGLEYGL